MSEYQSKKRNRGSVNEDEFPLDDSQPRASQSSRPGFMTVGTGSMSQNAERLTSMIGDDSGYGGSLNDGEASSSGWQNDRFDYSETLTDIPVPLSSSSYHCNT